MRPSSLAQLLVQGGSTQQNLQIQMQQVRPRQLGGRVHSACAFVALGLPVAQLHRRPPHRPSAPPPTRPPVAQLHRRPPTLHRRPFVSGFHTSPFAITWREMRRSPSGAGRSGETRQQGPQRTLLILQPAERASIKFRISLIVRILPATSIMVRLGRKLAHRLQPLRSSKKLGGSSTASSSDSSPRSTSASSSDAETACV